jgi:hypothetical protein
MVGYATWAVEPDVAASGDSAGMNFSDSVGLVSSEQQGDRRASRGRGHRAILGGGIAPEIAPGTAPGTAEG